MLDGLSHHRMTNGTVGLHAVSLGEGPAVVLLHGFPQHWWIWRATMQELAGQGYRVVAVDQRGCGGSDIPPAGYDKATLATDVQAVMDALELPSASVVGYDHGGGTALALAYTAPERVERLTVIEYAPPGFGDEMGLTAAPGNVNWQLAFFTQPDVAVQFIAGKERELLAWYFWHWAYDPDAVTQEDFEVYVRQLQKPGALRGGMMHFASVFEDTELFTGWADGGRLTMPCLGISGEVASGTYPEMSLRALAEDVRGAVIPGAGHWVAEEQPTALNQLLAEFIGEGQPEKAQ
ncbi:MAG: alpha/beta fold hydrolase [Phycicoccus sp.]